MLRDMRSVSYDILHDKKGSKKLYIYRLIKTAVDASVNAHIV